MKEFNKLNFFLLVNIFGIVKSEYRLHPDYIQNRVEIHRVSSSSDASTGLKYILRLTHYMQIKHGLANLHHTLNNWVRVEMERGSKKRNDFSIKIREQPFRLIPIEIGISPKESLSCLVSKIKTNALILLYCLVYC